MESMYYEHVDRPKEPMSPMDSIKTCFSKWSDWGGRATRSEFWWFFASYLVVRLILLAAIVAIAVTVGFDGTVPTILLWTVELVHLAIFVPLTCVAVRRLHDTDRSGWWLLSTPLLPLTIILGVFLIQEGGSRKNRFGSVPRNIAPSATLREVFEAFPDVMMMAAKGAWRGRERVLAVFAGVFLSSLVITTVLAYSAGLSLAFLQVTLESEVFDAKIDFADDPGENSLGRTNDSAAWEGVCDELVEMEEISDCGLVFGRQGLRLSSAWDEGGLIPQPLNVESASGEGDWQNVSWDYPEALESGPPINDQRTIRFYGEGVWDGDLGERHSRSIVYGSWPESAEDAANERGIVLPSQIASRAGVGVNDTIESLSFSYVYDTADVFDGGVGDCPGFKTIHIDGFVELCKVNLTVTDLKVLAIYEEAGPGNPTLLFNPLMVSESVLNDSQRLTLMDADHGYLGIAVDRNELPSSSTDATTAWLDDLSDKIEGGSKIENRAEYTDSGIKVQYNDMISGSISFFRILLGLIATFDYILMIPIVILSFSVLVYGLLLSLEQRRREISIHRVIGGSESSLTSLIMREVAVISIIAWLAGYLMALASVPVILDAVGFMAFEKSDFRVRPSLSLVSTLLVFFVTVVISLIFGRSRTRDFLNIEIDEGVKRVTARKKSRLWLHMLVFVTGILAFVDSWVESNGGFWIFTSSGIVEQFFANAVLALLGPFFLWIGGALVLGRIGAAGPRIVTALLGWSPVLADVRRGLKGSGSSEAVNRLSIILLLTLSIVTLAAVQGYTGTVVDERSTSAQTGADMQVQFSSAVSEQQAMDEVLLAIERTGSSEITGVSHMTSTGFLCSPVDPSCKVTKQGDTSRISVWILFDGHENTLHWDEQTIPGDEIAPLALEWAGSGFTAGSDVRRALDVSEVGSNITLEFSQYELAGFGADGEPVVTRTVTETNLSYMGRHSWVPGVQSGANEAILIGEGVYRSLVGDSVVDSHTSSTWFFELCDEYDRECQEALEDLNFQVTNGNGIISVSDWGSKYDEQKRNGGLIFGTPGLLSLQFVVASLASIASAFVFLSLVLTQRKKELAIIQAIGGSHQQVFKTVLFEILSILLVSMGLGVILGLAIAQSFNGFFFIFGFIFQIFLGDSIPINRDLVWPWTELVLVNLSVFIAVMIALIFTTRRALKSDLAVVLKGE
tara:strand:+ start:2334 stop:5900 length:3567 start_codon:yes stop_codon:yes gene_type:complete